MKKNFLIFASAKRISMAVLASVLLMTATANAAEKSGKNLKPAISFVGSESNLMKFNVNYTNTGDGNIALELINDAGEVLYYKEFADKTVNKTIYLKNIGVKCQVKFLVRAGKDIVSEWFDIEPQTKVVNETVVTAL